MAARGLNRVVKQLVEHFPIGQTGQTVVRCEVFDPRVCLGLFVRAVEVIEGKGDILRKPLQEFDELGCKRFDLD